MAAQPASMSNVARRNILDLPNDILVDIVGHFRHATVDNFGGLVRCFGRWTYDEAKMVFQDLQNVRLVCRAFHQLASLHLCPVLRLPLEKSSLDKIDAILKNPSILQGVRTVQIVLHYRPKEIAQSLALFRQRRLAELDQMSMSNQTRMDTWYWGGHDYDDETICELPRRFYVGAVENHRAIRDAWGPDSDLGDGEVEGDETNEWQSILRKGYREYREKHEEQHRLISDRSFVEAILKLLSQTPRPCWLAFTDEMPFLVDRYNHHPTMTVYDRERLCRYMSSPHKWSAIEALGREVDLAPTTLLGTLPVAIHRRGLKLQGVNTGCFPLFDGHYGIYGQSQASSWDDLAASCKRLRSFSWGKDGTLITRHIRPNPPQGEDKACLDRYFGAMLSSAHLENLELDFCTLGLHDGQESRTLLGKNVEFDLGGLLSRMPYPLLRHVRITNVAVTQVNLERFIQGLGEELRSLDLYCIELSGSWAGIMDTLHQRHALRCLEGRCKIKLARVWGDEFEVRNLEMEEAENDAWLFDTDWEPAPEPVLITQSRQYVNGDPQISENPLRRIHGNPVW